MFAHTSFRFTISDDEVDVGLPASLRKLSPRNYKASSPADTCHFGGKDTGSNDLDIEAEAKDTGARCGSKRSAFLAFSDGATRSKCSKEGPGAALSLAHLCVIPGCSETVAVRSPRYSRGCSSSSFESCSTMATAKRHCSSWTSNFLGSGGKVDARFCPIIDAFTGTRLAHCGHDDLDFDFFINDCQDSPSSSGSCVLSRTKALSRYEWEDLLDSGYRSFQNDDDMEPVLTPLATGRDLWNQPSSSPSSVGGRSYFSRFASRLNCQSPPPAAGVAGRLNRDIKNMTPPSSPMSACSPGAFAGKGISAISKALAVLEGWTIPSVPLNNQCLPINMAFVSADHDSFVHHNEHRALSPLKPGPLWSNSDFNSFGPSIEDMSSLPDFSTEGQIVCADFLQSPAVCLSERENTQTV